MKRFKRVMCWSLVVGALLANGFVYAEDIDRAALMRETQRMSHKSDDMTMVWWIPEEYWAASLAQTPGITSTQIEEFLKVIRPYTMVAVMDGTVGAFAGVTYKSEDWVRANTRLVDAQGKSYVPRTEDEADADTKNMLQMIKPVLVNMLGPMGKNVHFLLFPAKTEAGARIAAAKEKGQFIVKLGEKDFKWRLPLDALLPSKIYTGCKQECKGSWSFCPWCGKSLGQK
jgi:hypothetical protein